MKRNEVVPLGMELAPVGSTPTTLGGALAPLIEGCVSDLQETTDRLRRLTTMAEKEGNVIAEAALADRRARHATRILKLFAAAHRTGEVSRPLSNEQVPRWDSIPVRARELFDEAFREIERHTD